MSYFRIKIILCLIIIIFIFIPCDLFAHLAPGRIHVIPGVDPAEIVIDGDPSDWLRLFPAPLFTENNFAAITIDPQSGQLNRVNELGSPDLSFKIWLAWAPNQIMGFVWRIDNVYINELNPAASENDPRFFRYNFDNDSFSIMLDADHSGGRYHNVDVCSLCNIEDFPSESAQWYNIVPSAPDSQLIDINELNMWPNHSPWAEVAGVVILNEPAVLMTEFSISAWDSLTVGKGEAEVPFHRFQSGDVIGLQVQLRDYDQIGFRSQQLWKWVFFYGEQTVLASINADLLEDFLLLPPYFEKTIIRSSSWARIKASFK